MGNFSVDPQQNANTSRQKDYVGVRIEQGVPVLDRDLNLLGDVIAASVREVVDRYLGSGTAPNDNGFAILANGSSNNFTLTAGSYLVGGLHVTNTANRLYTSQPNVAVLTTPPVGVTRPDVVYLDVWLTEVDELEDTSLANDVDVRMRTSVRVRPAWAVRVAENTTQLPAAAPGHAHALLARLQRITDRIQPSMVQDQRTRSLNLADSLRRLNVLENALKPTLVTGEQFSAPNSYVGRVVYLNGHALNVGNVQVTLSSTDGTQKQATLASPALFNQLAILIPDGITGTCRVTVTTDLGSVTTTDTLYVYGPPSFKVAPGQFSPSSTYSTGIQVTLYGNHFDGPNPKVFFGGVQAATPTVVGTGAASQLKVLVPNLAPGNYYLSVKTDVSATSAVSTEFFSMKVVG